MSGKHHTLVGHAPDDTVCVPEENWKLTISPTAAGIINQAFRSRKSLHTRRYSIWNELVSTVSNIYNNGSSYQERSVKGRSSEGELPSEQNRTLKSTSATSRTDMRMRNTEKCAIKQTKHRRRTRGFSLLSKESISSPNLFPIKQLMDTAEMHSRSDFVELRVGSLNVHSWVV